MIHRDLKPANIMLRDETTPVLTDFGAAVLEHAREVVAQTDATLALAENPDGYTMRSSYQLPPSPVPLIKLIAQQSGCFRVVDRAAGLRSTIQESQLKEAGIVRADSTVSKGKGYEAQFTLTPSLTFSEQDAGRQIGGRVQERHQKRIEDVTRFLLAHRDRHHADGGGEGDQGIEHGRIGVVRAHHLGGVELPDAVISALNSISS